MECFAVMKDLGAQDRCAHPHTVSVYLATSMHTHAKNKIYAQQHSYSDTCTNRQPVTGQCCHMCVVIMITSHNESRFVPRLMQASSDGPSNVLVVVLLTAFHRRRRCCGRAAVGAAWASMAPSCANCRCGKRGPPIASATLHRSRHIGSSKANTNCCGCCCCLGAVAAAP